MTEDFVGKCPLCSGALAVDGKKVNCENSDYTASRAEFDSAWDTLGEVAGTSLPAAEFLLGNLVELNEIE